MRPSQIGGLTRAAAILSLFAVAGCQQGAMEPLALLPEPDPAAQECLARAMYFESQRSSRDGMLAVGSVVMNRLESGAYSDTVCGVVGQKNQFAPGVMSRDMTAGKELAMEVAGDVMAGVRHPAVDEALFFHQAGLSFPYGNMNYVAIAGGNAFYEKVSRRERDGPMTTQADIRNAYAAQKVARTPARAAIEAGMISEFPAAKPLPQTRPEQP